METFSQLGLGTSYTNVLNIEKRITCGVANRMDETGGFCLPPFVLLGKSLYFAGDNIDFQVNTQDGQGFFNGTLLVLNQNQTPEDKEKYTAANEALVIPHKITPYNVTYKYSCPQSNDWKEVRFQRFKEGAYKELSSTKESFDGAWFLSSFAHRKSFLPATAGVPTESNRQTTTICGPETQDQN